MNNQEILDNAPEGATHIDDEGDYCKTMGIRWVYHNRHKWYQFDGATGMRLLTDIRRIAELEKSGNEMAIIISDLRAHLKIRGGDV